MTDLFEIHGDDFDKRLLFLKEKYTSKEDRDQMNKFVLSLMDETDKKMEEIDKRLDRMIAAKVQMIKKKNKRQKKDSQARMAKSHS